MVWLAADPRATGLAGRLVLDRRARPFDRIPSTRVSPADRRRLWDAVVRLAGSSPIPHPAHDHDEDRAMTRIHERIAHRPADRDGLRLHRGLRELRTPGIRAPPGRGGPSRRWPDRRRHDATSSACAWAAGSPR